jgi:hypothetical protein
VAGAKDWRDSRAMPTIHRDGRYRFFFFSEEHLPPHVHVETNDGYAKFTLGPVRLVGNDRVRPRDLARIAEIVHIRAAEFEDAWHGYFGTDRR